MWDIKRLESWNNQNYGDGRPWAEELVVPHSIQHKNSSTRWEYRHSRKWIYWDFKGRGKGMATNGLDSEAMILRTAGMKSWLYH
jgi:hypothetical protein